MDSPVIAMILHAGWAARVVLIILLLFSLVTWTIVFDRWTFLKKAAAANRRFRDYFDKCKKIAELDRAPKGAANAPLAVMGGVGCAEYQRILTDARAQGGARDWSFFLQNQFTMVAERTQGAFTGIVSTFDRGVFLLAMVSSLSPFLGLLGTVWGIMNAFYEIGNQGSASLPVVAPGIAEALVATLAGLAVAIPALFFYNYFHHSVERLENGLDEFRELMVVRLKRELLEQLYVGQRGNV